jgi:hypothetical protein
LLRIIDGWRGRLAGAAELVVGLLCELAAAGVSERCGIQHQARLAYRPKSPLLDSTLNFPDEHAYK